MRGHGANVVALAAAIGSDGPHRENRRAVLLAFSAGTDGWSVEALQLDLAAHQLFQAREEMLMHPCIEADEDLGRRDRRTVELVAAHPVECGLERRKHCIQLAGIAAMFGVHTAHAFDQVRPRRSGLLLLIRFVHA
jgi:hypothetical protein